MKTEKEYADELIEQYMNILAYNCIQCAINDVENTIEALNYAWTNFDNNSMDDILKYYETVLQILKDKL